MSNDKIVVTLEESENRLYMIIPDTPNDVDDPGVDFDSGCITDKGP